MTARKKPETKRYKRARGVPITFYLSNEEKTKLLRKCEARGCTASDLIRNWINLEPRRKQQTPEPEPIDPRQITVHEVLEAHQ